MAGQIETYLFGVQRQLDAVAGLWRGLAIAPLPTGLRCLTRMSARVRCSRRFTCSMQPIGCIPGLPETSGPARGFDRAGSIPARFLRRRTWAKRVWSEVFLSVVTGRLVGAGGSGQQSGVVGEIAIEPLAAFFEWFARPIGPACIDSRPSRPGYRSFRACLRWPATQLESSTHRPRGIVWPVLDPGFEFEGEALLGTVVGVPRVDWIVLIAQPQREIFRQVATIPSVMVVVGALLLAILAGSVLARACSKRFAGYVEQTGAIARGDYGRPWPTSPHRGIRRFGERSSAYVECHSPARTGDSRQRSTVSRPVGHGVGLVLGAGRAISIHLFFRGRRDAQSGADRHRSPALLGKTRWEIPSDMTAEQWAEHRSMLEAHQSFRDFEYRRYLNDGTEHWFSINGQPRFDAAGRFVGYRGTGRDITERKRAEAHQRLAEAVFEAAQDAILVLDSEGRIVAVNPTFTTITGYTETEVRGKPHACCGPAASRRPILQPCGRPFYTRGMAGVSSGVDARTANTVRCWPAWGRCGTRPVE